MKTSIKFISCILLLTTLSITSLRAESNKANFLNKILQKVITYPEFAKEQNLEGVVLVSLNLNNDGSISINLTNESNANLKDYVISKLKKLKILPSNELVENTYLVKFEFKLKCSFSI